MSYSIPWLNTLYFPILSCTMSLITDHNAPIHTHTIPYENPETIERNALRRCRYKRHLSVHRSDPTHEMYRKKK